MTSENRFDKKHFFLNYNKRTTIFMNTIEKTVESYLDFWRELLEDSPDISKL